nr:thiamine pyrophosphokinase [uncultured Mucilaginibacter sp.]
MSSHHIVREKQEPALLILGMDTFDLELFGQLLEWSPTVITTVDIAEKLNSLGIKVDRILSDNQADDVQSDVKYIPTNGISSAQAALQFLVAENYMAVNIVIDELNLADFESFVPHINLVVFHQQKKTYPISSAFTKWLPAGEVITLHSQPDDLVTSGLSQAGMGQHETIADGVIKLEFTDSFIFISETI